MDKKEIALVVFGRSHWLKLPHVGIIILANKINQLKNYSCEVFDYADFPIYSTSSDHLSLIHFNAFNNKYPIGFIPELPILDLLIQFIKEAKDLNYESFKANILDDSLKLKFIINYCKKLGNNPYFFIEMLERFFKRIPSIINELENFKYIGFFNVMANFFLTLLLSEILRLRFNKLTMGGGPQITYYFDFMKIFVDKKLFYDYIVAGDAEDSIEQILDEFTDNKANFFDCKKSLDKIESYQFDFNFDCVLDKGYLYHYLTYELSRGCPFRCKFCGEYGVHGRLALKDPIFAAKHLVKLTEYYSKRKGFIPFWRITDSLLNFDESHLNKFLDKLIELKNISKNLFVKALSFAGYARGNISDNLAKKLWKAGCIELWIGVEFLDDDILKYLKKNLNSNQIINSILILLHNHISIGLLFISPNYALMEKQIPEDHVYNEIIAIKNLVKKVISEVRFFTRKSGPFPYIQKLFIAAHVCLAMLGTSEYHRIYPKENWISEDFYYKMNACYASIPKNYILKDNMNSSIRDYYFKEQILRKIFPVNKDSKLERIDELLEFDTMGKMVGVLKDFDHNVLQTPDYFTLRKSDNPDESLIKIRNYLMSRSKEV